MVLQLLESASTDNVNAVYVILAVRERQKRWWDVKGVGEEALRFVGSGESLGYAVCNYQEIQIASNFIL